MKRVERPRDGFSGIREKWKEQRHCSQRFPLTHGPRQRRPTGPVSLQLLRALHRSLCRYAMFPLNDRSEGAAAEERVSAAGTVLLQRYGTRWSKRFGAHIESYSIRLVCDWCGVPAWEHRSSHCPAFWKLHRDTSTGQNSWILASTGPF